MVKVTTQKIIDIFTQLADFNKLLGERFRVRAYQVAIAGIRRATPPGGVVTSCEQLLKMNVSGLSKTGSLCQKIDEIIKTGTLKELKKLQRNPKIKKYRELMSVKDIGLKLAKTLIEKHKIFSIKKLHAAVKKGTITLTRNQTLGLVYHKQLVERIPHSEMTKIFEIIKRTLAQCSETKLVRVVPAGSYRRECATSHDIDMLIFTPKVKNREQLAKSKILCKVVDLLTVKGFMLDYFNRGSTKFSGIIAGPTGKARQIDIRLLPTESYATALLYFTGSKNFNQTMRRKAIQLGYKLSEYSLLNLKTKKMELVKTERDVFKKLKMKWVPPTKRN